ncbi:hypothetical protein Q1W71_23685 [Flavobacterium pectinovorum]|uniref:hypothetical protein n=1 Tax=Flavobacterium pectinovorum TaxID=29533 RepID=UPI00265E946B|nr:hypothetical protein [Flavobacterium pectinovorum]WKL47937.1 hypothetical protein Q1W71_23685 [Flavobacterium pectinovorum]
MKKVTKIEVLMIFGIISILFTPILLTRSVGLFDFSSTEYSNIGSTIGGITAPFASILGSILVYLALKAQIDANTLIQKQLKKQEESDVESKVLNYLKKQLDIINYDLNGLHYTYKPQKSNEGQIYQETGLTGSDVIRKYLVSLKVSNRDCDNALFKEHYQIESIKQLLILIDNFVKLANTEKISEKDKHYLLFEIKYQYVTKIKNHFDTLKDHKSSNLVERCAKCNQYHNGIPDEFYDLISSINSGLNI